MVTQARALVHDTRVLATGRAPTVVDLFAGCGGFSFGFSAAGFDVLLAVEKSEMASETYFHNFVNRLGANNEEYWRYLKLPLKEQVTAGLAVKTVSDVLDDKGAVAHLRSRGVDVIVGGPPCQGFSHAGRRDPADPRSDLVWDFVRSIVVLEPRMFIMENVPGLGHRFNKADASGPLQSLATVVGQVGPGYVVSPLSVNAQSFGVPQHRPRAFLVGVKIGSTGGLPLLEASTSRGTVTEAMWDLNDEGYAMPMHHPMYCMESGKYASQMRFDRTWLPLTAREAKPPESPTNHELRRHSSRVTLRFRLAHYLADAGLTLDGIQRRLAPLPSANGSFPACWPPGDELAADRASLQSLVEALRSKKHSQRPLSPIKPSPTVMTLPDDFVHPWSARTLTVREMARLQSFPDMFEFRAKATTGGQLRKSEVPQYTQVGNAVPPLLARALAAATAESLS
jgi:DNA (cytosine-5)-methyltransferase 1